MLVTVDADETGDEGAPGFFRRNRVTRLVVGVIVSVVLIAAYLFGIQSYRAGLAQALPDQAPPPGGVSVVIVPEQVSPNEQELPAQVLLFPSPELLDSAGLLTQELEVRIQPALSGQTLLFPAGEADGSPDAWCCRRPAPCRSIRSTPTPSKPACRCTRCSPTATSPWPRRRPCSSGCPAGARRSPRRRQPCTRRRRPCRTEIARDGSTKSIALLLLLLMVILATIAILVTGSATRGRMKLELSVASWMTALLFALIPLRGFFPGSPPLGSWMDILVFFWVELILMLSVAAVVTTILMRANDARHHPKENP